MFKSLVEVQDFVEKKAREKFEQWRKQLEKNREEVNRRYGGFDKRTEAAGVEV